MAKIISVSITTSEVMSLSYWVYQMMLFRPGILMSRWCIMITIAIRHICDQLGVCSIMHYDASEKQPIETGFPAGI